MRIRRSDQPTQRPPRPDRPPPGAPAGQDGWWFSAAANHCLAQAPAPRVTMIAAPAGSGKSRLVRQWLARSPDRPWLWLTFDSADRSQPDQLPTAIDQAVQDFAEPAGVLVLSDLEVLTAEQQTGLIDRLIERWPAGLRLIALSAGAGLPSSCLVRLAGELAELRTAQLWWPADEIADRLHRLTGVQATESEAGQLHQLTGGWPAGVLILGQAMRLYPLTPDSTADPGLLDFITDRLLNRLAEPVRRFVLSTSVLTELQPGACRLLVPDANPDAILAELHRQALIEPKHAHSQQIQYRPMIRAAALRALRCEQAGAEAQLLRLAGQQALDTGRPSAAMASFLACGAWQPALAVLASAAPGGFRGWAPAALQRRLTQLPTLAWAENAEHRALFAFAAAIGGDQLLSAEVIAQTPAALLDQAPWWLALTLTIQALNVKPPGGQRGAYRVALAALSEIAVLDREDRLPEFLGVGDRPALEGLAHLLAARAALFDGDPVNLRRHLRVGWGIEGAELPRYAVLIGLGTDALASAWDGSLAAAQRRADRARRLADQAGLSDHPMIGLTLLAGVEVLRARGRSAEALAELDAVAAILRQNESFVAAASGGQFQTAAARILRAALLLDRADLAAAGAELELLGGTGDDELPVALESARAVVVARLHLLRDDVVSADQVLREAPGTGAVAAIRITVALFRQAHEEARAVLQNWPGQDAPDNRLRLLLAAAAIDLALDRRPEAGRGIDQALTVAEPDGHLQIFLEAPPAARVLTSVVLRRSPTSSPWRAELADRLDEIRLVTDSGSLPVTRRELAVLERLTSSLTHAQIAAQMFVSENTLKSHCRNLYRKLGVNSRADAVRAARARGWLDGKPETSSRGGLVLDVNITPVPAVVEL